MGKSKSKSIYHSSPKNIFFDAKMSRKFVFKVEYLRLMSKLLMFNFYGHRLTLEVHRLFFFSSSNPTKCNLFSLKKLVQKIYVLHSNSKTYSSKKEGKERRYSYDLQESNLTYGPPGSMERGRRDQFQF